ncbi:class II aldolase and adducin N-terminal domain-containing protein [Campylobacter geochelonis]|uniref:class II aldolase and adducin N-terminal domain-containing protein n=1 Tax=Campylobacter geochelonis TaxID=1780362 RepID=UPI000770ADA1|nr:class II aldolase and adducin N-terminal domain-containing protein [Campylobacter geochelonis]CZE47930.1 Ribulose-5-phosphate 4-epimerase and related epimerases and aldolases [Campylobacter geochelonis]CZE50795.1 Ribulose-5-phosphate 4-epimerase and related epimerases and aldolases [Campylobacter geochelonis]
MDLQISIELLQKLSLSMFRKSFFGIFHGSISAKIASNKFIINKKNAIFDDLKKEDFVLLYDKKDYRWNDASIDSDIHLHIYQTIFEAKYAVFAMPPHTVSYSLNHDYIIPKDYFGYEKFEKIKIYDPKNFDDWYERAPYEICKYLQEQKKNFIIIRGYGVVAYHRTLQNLAKDIALLDNSCKILQYEKIYN